MLKLEAFLPKNSIIIITKEFHKDKTDFHYHVYINIQKTKGIRKNTYKKLFRKEFDKFSGITLDVSGVKRVNKTTHYILKDINMKSLVNYTIDGKREFLLRNTSLLNILDKGTINILSTLKSILSFERIIEWSLRRIKTTMLFRNKQNWCKRLWQISRRIIKIKDTSPILFREKGRIRDFLEVVNKYKIGWNHLTYIQKVIYFLLIRSNYFQIHTKQKNLLVAGKPNRGKTSLLNKFIEVMEDNNLFLFLGRRKGDFTGYSPNNTPILVFDDILNKKSKWDPRILLKVWAHEKHLVDVKYKEPIIVEPTMRIILTNDVFLLRKKQDFNLRARLQITIVDRDPGWTNIDKEEFLVLTYILTEDLLVSLTQFEKLRNFIKWGFIYDIVSGKQKIYKE